MAQKFLNGIEISGNLTVDSNSAIGATVLDIQGTQGQLFSVTNSLTGDLFSVSDISGIPILNVNSSGLITIDGALDSFNVTEFIKHEGDTGTNIQFLTGQMILKNSGGKYINLHSNGIFYFEASAYQFNTGNATFAGSVTASNLSGTNTGDQTLSSLGAAAASHTHTFSSLTSKPTTISGYGITDTIKKNARINANASTINETSVSIWDVSGATDDPSGANDGLLTTNYWDSSDWATQNYHDFHANKLYIRSKQSGTWQTSWAQAWTTDQLTAANKTNYDTAYGWGNHAGLYLPTATPSRETNINTLGNYSRIIPWNNVTVGRPAQAQSNEYGAGIQLGYDSLFASQIAHDFDQNNLYFRKLTLSTDSGDWNKVWHDGNLTDNSTNWNTAYTYSQAGHLPLAGGDMTGQTTHGDSIHTYWGNSNDLDIYHDNTFGSIIRDRGAGDLAIESNQAVRFRKSSTTELMTLMVPDGAVSLYYDNSKKFETTSAGATVTGAATATGALSTGYGLSLTNGATDFLLYNNALENVLYMRDTTNGAMITTWGVSTFTVNKNLAVTGTSAFTGNATFAGDITLDDDLNFSTNGFADISNTGTGAMRFKPSSQTLALTLTGANATFAGGVTVAGDLTVNGTTTTINTATVEVEDNILQLNTTQASPDTATAATSGISIYRGDGVTQASLIFDDADDTWDLTNRLIVADTIVASNFSGTHSGSSSGTNTGDQTLPTLSSLGALSTSGGTINGDLTVNGKITQSGIIDREEWGRSYTVNVNAPLPLLTDGGSALPTGGAYRVTGHISGTGTEQVAVAVFWNENGTWYINKTFEGGTSSNHVEFKLFNHGSGTVPTVTLETHTSNYTVHVAHERLSLEEGTGTDNLRGYFGSDSYLSWLESTNALTVPGTIAATNLSGTNTGDQTLPTASSLGAVTLTGSQTISGSKTFTSSSNTFNGHLYYSAYSATGQHYPHFQDGSNGTGADINWRQYYGSNYKSHTWASDASGNMLFTYQGGITAVGALTATGLDINGNADISGAVGIGTAPTSRNLSVFRGTAGSVATFQHYTDASNFAGLYINVSQADDEVVLNASGSSGGAFVFQQGNTQSLKLDTNLNATFAGKVITTEVESSGTLLLDAAADITIDAGGGDIILSDDATIFGTISSGGGSNLQIRSRVNNADMFFRGVDDGTEFNALTLDMSAGGNATFAGDVTVAGTLFVDGDNIAIEGDSPTISFIDNTSSADDFYIHVNSNNFYVLADRDGANNVNTGWDSPHPLQLEGDTNKTYLFGSEVKSAAFTLSTAYATSAQGTLATNALPKAGGTMTGILTMSQANAIPLNIVGTSSSYTAIAIKNTSSGNAGVYYDAMNGDLAGGDYGFIGQDDAGHMLYSIGASSPAPYHSFAGGSVGIGTTTPLQKLHVAGSIHMDGGLIRFPSSVTTLTLSNVSGSWNSLSCKGINLGDWNTIPAYGEILVGTYDFKVKRDDGTAMLTIAEPSGNATFAGDLTVSGGDITLGGTGRIQGIDTVSATTDAANKAYVDAKTWNWNDITAGTVPTWNQNTTGSSGSCTGNAATATTADAVAWGNITSRPYIVTASTTSATTTTTIANVVHATYTAAFFDFVIKNGTNVRAGVVYACHDGTDVEYTETSTHDLGDTSDVTLAVDISGANMRLRATTTSSTWTIKSLIRAI